MDTVKTDDYVKLNGNLGRVISTWPSSQFIGWEAEIYWLSTGERSVEKVSDLDPEVSDAVLTDFWSSSDRAWDETPKQL